MSNKNALFIPVYMFLAVLAFFWISPFSWLILTSLNPRGTGAFAIPDMLVLDNFIEVFATSSGRWLFNSVLISFGSASLSVLVSLFAAYPFSRLKFRGKNAILWGLLVIRIIPVTALLLPLFLFSIKLHWLNTWGLIFTTTVLNLPFSLLLLKNFYDTVPVAYEEAALIDGASLTQTITKILWPMAKSGITVIWFWTFNMAWNNFILPLIFLRNPKAWPMSVGLYSSFGMHGEINYGYLSAFSIIYAIPTIIIFFTIRRKLMSGLTGAGIK